MSLAQQSSRTELESTGNETSLILGKVYRILPDAAAAKDRLVRIIDESGEDYLFDKTRRSGARNRVQRLLVDVLPVTDGSDLDEENRVFDLVDARRREALRVLCVPIGRTERWT